VGLGRGRGKKWEEINRSNFPYEKEKDVKQKSRKDEPNCYQ
jgi:hypothetical protein